MPRRIHAAAHWALPVLLATGSSLALAHAGHDEAGAQDMLAAFFSGFVHPFTGFDHLAAMLMVGMWSALTARRIWLAPLGFALALLVGALAARHDIALPAVEPMIAASLLVLGLLMAGCAALPAAAGVAIATLFALFHGAAHGQELNGPWAAWALAGMVGATALLHAAGIALGLAMRNSPRRLPRIAGAVVALFGLSLLFAA